MAEHAAVDLHSTIVVREDPHTVDGQVRAPFRSDSFAELVGMRVHVPGLDHRYPHTLVGVDVAPDGMSARLSLRTRLERGHDLAAHLTIAPMTPEARVRVVDDETGVVWHDGTHQAPLVVGDTHRVNGAAVRVVSVSWPNRHPEHGAVQAHPETGEYPADVQEVRVVRSAPPQVVQAPEVATGAAQ